MKYVCIAIAVTLYQMVRDIKFLPQRGSRHRRQELKKGKVIGWHKEG